MPRRRRLGRPPRRPRSGRLEGRRRVLSLRAAKVKRLSQRFRLSEISHIPLTPAHGQGAFRDRHDTRAGWRWTWSASARMRSAGRAWPVSGRAARTRPVRFRVRQKRVVLTPGVCASRLAVVKRPDRVRASVIGKTTGAIVHRSPGRARHKPSNHCAGSTSGEKTQLNQCALGVVSSYVSPSAVNSPIRRFLGNFPLCG